MTVSTVSAKGREQQEKQIARFIKFSVMGSAVVHLAVLAFVMPLINLKSDGTEEPIEFIVLEESTAEPEELMPESEAIASATPEAMPEPEAIESPTPEPTPELMPEAEAIESATVEPEAIESATAEPTAELMPQPEAIESATAEPTAELMAEPTPEPEPLEAAPQTPVAEVAEAIETPRSELRAEALPGQRPPEPIPDPAPMPPQEMSPFTNSSPLDPGHNSRITDSNDIQGDAMGTESLTPQRLPAVPDVKIVAETRGLPSPVRYESPFNPGVIVTGESADPWESNLDRLSEPWNETEGTPGQNETPLPGVEADSTLGETGNLGNESGLEEIACRRCDPPPYPQLALDNAWEGTVILIADIAPDGTVISSEIQQSSGYDILDDVAREQIKTWKFDPSEQGQQGRVIPVLFAQ
ncbi:energy transducer TonB [Laspinema olomoucense]|uniref:energy transducer TonB n=1 Tax=Laspinema olomoucense TaxID=3231600 RepID=UPI0021BB8553|nr:TonB family protein [Laspinema sp. D3c]MCT7993384.1 TonB family protein [Laspinema sp. D3c]